MSGNGIWDGWGGLSTILFVEDLHKMDGVFSLVHVEKAPDPWGPMCLLIFINLLITLVFYLKLKKPGREELLKSKFLHAFPFVSNGFSICLYFFGGFYSLNHFRFGVGLSIPQVRWFDLITINKPDKVFFGFLVVNSLFAYLLKRKLHQLKSRSKG